MRKPKKSTVFLLLLNNFGIECVLNPNRSFDRLRCVFVAFPGFPFFFPAESCLPLCPDVVRYAFNKGNCQSARRQDEISLNSNAIWG